MLHSLHNYVFIFEHVNVIDISMYIKYKTNQKVTSFASYSLSFHLWLSPLHTSSKTTLPIGTVSVRGCNSRIWRDQKPVLERTA